MSFNHRYNTDDVIIRACIVGLVNELNNRINFENVWEDNRKEVVRVPFFYAMSGDERFLQDYFSNWSDCAPDFIEGNVDPIPRGTIFLSGVSVLAANLTSRYVRGYYTKEVEGELKRFNSYINSIPIQMNFSAEILADTSVDTFKIVQSAIATLYRTLVFSVNFKGFRVPVQAGFPDNYNINKQFEFTYGQTDRLKVTFDVELQAFLPIPDSIQEFFAGTNLQGFTFNSTPGGDPTVSNTVSGGANPSTGGAPIGLSGSGATDYMIPPADNTNSDQGASTSAGDGGNNMGQYGGYGTEAPPGYEGTNPNPNPDTGSGGDGNDIGNGNFNPGFWR